MRPCLLSHPGAKLAQSAPFHLSSVGFKLSDTLLPWVRGGGAGWGEQRGGRRGGVSPSSMKRRSGMEVEQRKKLNFTHFLKTDSLAKRLIMQPLWSFRRKGVKLMQTMSSNCTVSMGLPKFTIFFCTGLHYPGSLRMKDGGHRSNSFSFLFVKFHNRCVNLKKKEMSPEPLQTRLSRN